MFLHNVKKTVLATLSRMYRIFHDFNSDFFMIITQKFSLTITQNCSRLYLKIVHDYNSQQIPTALLFSSRAVKYDVEAAQLRDNGVFWIDFASIFQYFRNVFMNWNPGLFRFR